MTRTPESIEEAIAIELIRNDFLSQMIGTWKTPLDFAKRIVNDPDYQVSDDAEFNRWYGGCLDGDLEKMGLAPNPDDYESDDELYAVERDRSRTMLLTAALLILIDGISTARRYGPEPKTHSIGFGLTVTTSLAGTICDYHARIRQGLGAYGGGS